MYPAGDEVVPLFARAERLYCFDSTADKVLDEDAESTGTNSEGDDNELAEGIGTFVLLFEYRQGQQALIRVRTQPGSDDANLDFSDSNAVAASRLSDIEPGVNVVRIALVDVPREDSLILRRRPSCTIWLSQTSRRTVELGSAVKFNPYLNVYRIRCFKAAVSS